MAVETPHHKRLVPAPSASLHRRPEVPTSSPSPVPKKASYSTRIDHITRIARLVSPAFRQTAPMCHRLLTPRSTRFRTEKAVLPRKREGECCNSDSHSMPAWLSHCLAGDRSPATQSCRLDLIFTIICSQYSNHCIFWEYPPALLDAND